MHPANAGHKNQGPIKNRLAASARLGVKERCEGCWALHRARPTRLFWGHACVPHRAACEWCAP
eukprot:scaffold267546_cov23-Tisochrysis_lutea.AAC.1